MAHLSELIQVSKAFVAIYEKKPEDIPKLPVPLENDAVVVDALQSDKTWVLVKKVIECGFIPDKQPKYKVIPPLFLACIMDECPSEIIKLLIDSGAPVNQRLEVVPEELKDQFGYFINMTPLQLACIYRNDSHYNTVKTLLENGADVNVKVNGHIPLIHWHIALDIQGEPSKRLIDLLLSYGLKIDERDNFNMTPHELAERIYGSNCYLTKYLAKKTNKS